MVAFNDRSKDDQSLARPIDRLLDQTNLSMFGNRAEILAQCDKHFGPMHKLMSDYTVKHKLHPLMVTMWLHTVEEMIHEVANEQMDGENEKGDRK